MSLKGLLQCLGDKIDSVEEETFDLFSQEPPSGNLGFVDPKSPVLEITVAGHDLTIHQSPAILSSNRAGGTTGAVVWKVTPVFADWISRPDNIFFSNGILTSQSAVVELGCGISAVVGLLLAPRIHRYVLTDQSYVARLVEQNMEENRHAGGTGRTSSSSRRSKGTSRLNPSSSAPSKLAFRPLDWERDTVTASLTGSETVRSFDAVLCCDCIYNEALVEPLVQTCADICGLRAPTKDDGGDEEKVPCVCIVAQQLRDSDVFAAWLTRFAQHFDVWRVPDSLLVDGLQANSGFAVHVGVLKDAAGSVHRYLPQLVNA